MKYEFTPVCEVGITVIDNQHRQFFEYINAALEALETEDDEAIIIAENLMKKLRDYAEFHFTEEEEYMQSNHDAELVRQIREHQKFRDDIDAMAQGEITREKLSDMVNFLAKWLYRHILTSDTLIGKVNHHGRYQFSDEFKTNIDFVDEEHKNLFEIIGRAWDVLEDDMIFDKYDKIVTILNELKVYTQRHFSDEEEYMESINYEFLDAQRNMHNAFIERIVNLDLDDLDDMDENQNDYLIELLEFLGDWLVNHILRMDTRIPTK